MGIEVGGEEVAFPSGVLRPLLKSSPLISI